jgi:hypothetical protein
MKRRTATGKRRFLDQRLRLTDRAAATQKQCKKFLNQTGRTEYQKQVEFNVAT